MTRESEQLQTPGDDEALDRVLAMARWPEPRQQVLRDLQLAYQYQRWWKARRALSRVAAAAVIVLAVGAWMLMTRSSLRKVAVQPVTPTVAPQKPAPLIPSRPPNLAERALILSMNRRSASTHPSQRAVNPLDLALSQVEQGNDSARAASKLLAARPDAARELAQRIRLDPSLHIDPAAQLLAMLSIPRDIPMLLEIARSDDHRRIVLPALLRVGDARCLSRLAHSSTDSSERRTILSALLHRNPSQSVDLYLPFITDPETSADAIAALDRPPGAIVDALFVRLDDAHVSARLAAARMLGAIDGPVVTRRLANMVNDDVNRREALFALMSSRGQDAIRYLSQARKDAAIASTISALEPELNNPS